MRPSWDEYFMEITRVVASRSTCLRRHVGSVLVRDRRILATGYNGAPTGLLHCNETDCLRQEQNVPSGQRHELCRGLHAEQNAIIQAALNGVSTRSATLYCTHHPCVLCAKMILNAGITRVCLMEPYPDAMASAIFCEAGIQVHIL